MGEEQLKRLICVLLVVGLVVPLIPVFSPVARAQTPLSRTVWENPYTLTTHNLDNRVNSTFYTFPKVIWNGSQYVDYILNLSDMSAGIGSVYIKVYPEHTVFYDPSARAPNKPQGTARDFIFYTDGYYYVMTS
jgi:hypothetical protein